MSIYLELLEEAVAKCDLIGVRSRICNLLVEKNGLSSREISQLANEIEKRLATEGVQLFATPDNNVVSNISKGKEAFRQEVANLGLNFSKERFDLVCRLKEEIEKRQSTPVPHSIVNVPSSVHVSPYTVQRSKSSSSHKGPRQSTHRSAKSVSKQNINIARGAIVGGAVGLVAGAICHAAIIGLIVGCATGGAIGYNYSKK